MARALRVERILDEGEWLMYRLPPGWYPPCSACQGTGNNASGLFPCLECRGEKVDRQKCSSVCPMGWDVDELHGRLVFWPMDASTTPAAADEALGRAFQDADLAIEIVSIPSEYERRTAT